MLKLRPFFIRFGRSPSSWVAIRIGNWAMNIKSMKSLLFSERNGYTKVRQFGPIAVIVRWINPEPLPPGVYNVQTTEVRETRNHLEVTFRTEEGHEYTDKMRKN